MRFFAGVLLGFLAGVLAASWLGPLLVSHPTVAGHLSRGGGPELPGRPLVREGAERGSLEAGSRELEQALLESWFTGLLLAAKVDSLELLVEQMREQDLDARQVAERVVSSMSDRDLRSIVASAAHLSPEQLDEVTDVQAFAVRLAEVAMEDLIEPAGSASDADRVVFTTRPTTVDPGAVARDRFEPSDARIYALFPTDHYERDSVVIKWLRTDRPRILLLRRHAVRSGDTYGYVWLRPKGGWKPGRYRVDVYATDEALTPLAGGRYFVE